MIENTQILGNKTQPARRTGHCGQKMRMGHLRLSAALCLAAIALSTSLAGCGQKGPLYLPAPANGASTPSSSTSK